MEISAVKPSERRPRTRGAMITPGEDGLASPSPTALDHLAHDAHRPAALSLYFSSSPSASSQPPACDVFSPDVYPFVTPFSSFGPRVGFRVHEQRGFSGLAGAPLARRLRVYWPAACEGESSPLADLRFKASSKQEADGDNRGAPGGCVWSVVNREVDT